MNTFFLEKTFFWDENHKIGDFLSRMANFIGPQSFLGKYAYEDVLSEASVIFDLWGAYNTVSNIKNQHLTVNH